MRLAYCAVALVALACLLVRAGRVGIAGDYLDPISNVVAQDEALYGHSAIRMAQHGGWLTPMFLGQYAPNEPPLLAVGAGLSARLFGVSRLALRLPVALLVSLAVGLVFWWTAEFQSWQAGACAAGLLVSNHPWHSLGSMCLTDGLLAAFYVAALFCLFADPWLESLWSVGAFSIAVAGGILSHGAAGLAPLVVLGLYWIAAPRNERPRLRQAMLAASLAIVLAAPWFLYQMAARGHWYWPELAASGIPGYGAAPQTSQESRGLFYLTRITLLDPVLFAAAAVALPHFLKALRKRSAPTVLLLLGLALPVAAAFFWRDQSVSYLLPMAPLMAILAAAYNPLCTGRTTKWMVALLVVAFVAKSAVPSAPWGLSFQAGTKVAAAPLVSSYCEQARGNELILINAEDGYYATLLPLARVRYVPEDNLETTIRMNPDSDLILPERYRAALAPVAQATHDIVTVSPGWFLLLSHRVLPPGGRKWSCRL
ncbi:MAG TPA: glycosyltransferase family 39 protein [Bryobacteraceae bacterium]|nr:glycosyltransferase family 39 protein [Bryobacteraceae bacterium]